MNSGHGSTRVVVANGIVQTVLVAGRDDADLPTVLLIHGLGWDHGLWRFQVAPLVARGFRVVAPDLRGMGASAKPEAQWSIADHVADLAALLDQLGTGRAALAGFSLGGMIAAAFAIAHPARAEALFMAAAPVSSSEAGRAGTEAMLARALELGPEAFAAEQAAMIWHPRWAAAHPAEIARFIAWRAAMDQRALHAAFRSSYGIDLRDGLRGLRIPARIVAADSDPFAALEAMRAVAAMMPEADLVVVREAGHMAPIEQPEAFNAALLGFLDRVRFPGS
jgi:pimeloyl-ACP methyl ester carboxylesterase